MVKVEEPQPEEAIAMLQSLKNHYQAHHQVEYTQDAIKQAVYLSHKYIQQRHLPDKAIDLLDEAGAAKRIKVIYTPPDMRKLESDRQQLEQEKSMHFHNKILRRWLIVK